MLKKNLRKIAGKPLIHYAIDKALKSKYIDHVFVSTDSKDIADEAIAAGADVPFLRPDYLASDTSPEWLSWQHAIRKVRELRGDFDIFVSIPATSPLRNIDDIDRCVAALMNDKSADAVITVCKAKTHPSFNMVTKDDQEFVRLVMPVSEKISRRQDTSQIYDITTVAYASYPEFILAESGLFQGRVKAVEIPQERALDIDTEYDLKVAELLIGEQKIKERV